MKKKTYLSILIALAISTSIVTGCGQETPEVAEEQTQDGNDTGTTDPYITGGGISPYYKAPSEETDEEATNDPDSSAIIDNTLLAGTATDMNNDDSQDDGNITDVGDIRVLNDLYVSTYGSDDNDGSYDAPLATIQKALDKVSPGYTVYIMSGVYKGANYFTNSGTEEAPITVTHAPGCNASSVMISLGYGEEGAIFDIAGQSNIQLIDLRIGNSLANWIYGVYIPQGSHDILIEETEFIDLCAPDIGAAYAILMYGNGSKEDDAIHDIYIYDNEIHNLINGRGMGIAASGNVDTITVEGNHIYGLSNSGIDIYGGDRTCTTDSLDQPRNVIVKGNEVHQIAAYDFLSCSGILIDGARDTEVTDNYVYECPCGIDICSENYNYDYPTKNIKVSGNTVHDNHDMGISIGGYNPNYYGVVRDSEISSNILYNNGYRANDGANGEIHFEKCDGITVSDNILRNHNYSYPVIGCGSDKTSEYVRNVTFINNLYAYDKPEKMVFRFQGNVYIGLDNWNKFTGGSDINSTGESK